MNLVLISSRSRTLFSFSLVYKEQPDTLGHSVMIVIFFVLLMISLLHVQLHTLSHHATRDSTHLLKSAIMASLEPLPLSAGGLFCPSTAALSFLEGKFTLRSLMTSSARRLQVSLYHRRYSVLNSVTSLLLQSPLIIRT